MQCYRGWLLATNDDGFITPFFLKVRNVDVFYSGSLNNKFFDSDAIDPDKVTDGEYLILPPGQTYVFWMDGWRVVLNNNEQFTITKDFAIDATTCQLDAVDKSRLKLNVKLPFKILAEDYKEVRIMKRCSAKPLILSHQNIVYGAVSEDKDISDLTIEIFQHDGGNFPDACLDDPEYQESIFQVTIEGFMQLGDYSHQDDGSQIGGEWDGTSSGVLAKDVYTKQEVQNIINQLRTDIESGTLLGPDDIIDVADDAEDSDVLDRGFVLEIENEDETTSTTQNTISEDQELEAKQNDEEILQIDINDIFGGSTLKKKK